MLKEIKTVLNKMLLVTLTLAISIAFVNAEEKYIRKEAIDFTWGNGKHQLGSNWKEYLNESGKYIGPADAWGESTGPTSIKINRKGNVFIQDMGNKRLLVFDKDGKFSRKLNLYTKEFYFMPLTIKDFAFDKKGNVCFLIERSPKSIIIFDHTLKFVKELFFEIPNRKEFSPSKIRIDSNDEIHIFDIWDRMDKRKIIKINRKDKEIEKVVYGRKYKFIPTAQQEIVIFKKTKNNLEILSHKSFQARIIKTKLENKFSWVSKIVNEDLGGNNYLLINIPDPNMPQKIKYVIQKYSPDGTLVADVILDQDDSLYFAQISGHLVDVDDNGNIYHLWIKKEGAKLVLWEKR